MTAPTFNRVQWTEEMARKALFREVVYLWPPDPDLDDLVGMDDPRESDSEAA